MAETDQNAYWLDPRHLEYHRRQFADPYRSTVAMADFVEAQMENKPLHGQALDIACGAGANMLYFARRFPNLAWTGVDIAQELFPFGEHLMREQPLARQPGFVFGDAYALSDVLPPRSFDLVFSLQTLSWMPAYEPLLGPMLSMAKPGGAVFISSLFTDALVDANIQLTQYEDETFGNPRRDIHYNVYCLDRFALECRKHGAISIEAADFEMDRDLPKPNHRQMGTYTELMANGKRLQRSGPLMMPWKFVIIRMAETVTPG